MLVGVFLCNGEGDLKLLPGQSEHTETEDNRAIHNIKAAGLLRSTKSGTVSSLHPIRNT